MRFDAGAAAWLLLVACGIAQAQAQPPAAMLAACAACHGPGGNATVAQFPSLAGQPKVFIETQLVLIREGLREVPSMKAVMTGMGDEEIVALARHFAAQPPEPSPAAAAAPVRAAQYALGAQASRQMLCGTCHLADYSGQQQVPRLAGQNEPYLLASMTQFRDNPGPGRDTIMAATLRGLSDADLANLAHYLSRFKP